jgi:hypothetical protein
VKQVTCRHRLTALLREEWWKATQILIVHQEAATILSQVKWGASAFINSNFGCGAMFFTCLTVVVVDVGAGGLDGGGECTEKGKYILYFPYVV